jgi:DNA-binding transcriptional LysR family regulator
MRAENQDQPPIEDLATFCLLVQLGEMKKVANRLGIDLSAVSRRMKPFQERLGLLTHKGSAWVPTERGREALPLIERLVRDHQALSGWLAGKSVAPESLVVATGSWGAVWLLPPALAQLKERLPAVQVRVRICRARERILGVRDGAIDLAVVSHEPEQVRGLTGQSGVVVEELGQEPFALLAAANTPAGNRLRRLPEKVPVSLERLGGLELVGLDEHSGVRRQLEARLRAAGAKPPRFGIGAGGWLAAREYARLGLGVALVPLSVLARMGREGLVVRLLDTAAFCMREHLLYRADADRQALHALRAALVDAARQAREG